jgi:hypothetical protein
MHSGSGWLRFDTLQATRIEKFELTGTGVIEAIFKNQAMIERMTSAGY